MTNFICLKGVGSISGKISDRVFSTKTNRRICLRYEPDRSPKCKCHSNCYLVKTLKSMPVWKFGNKKTEEVEEVEEIVEEVEVEVDSNGEEIEYVEEEVEVEEEEEEEEEVKPVPAKRAPVARKAPTPAASASDSKLKEVFKVFF